MLGTNYTLAILLTRVRDRITDFRLGVHTRGSVAVSLPGSKDCVTLPYGDIMQILSSLRLTPSDVFIDIGCGRGRVLCCAALFRVQRAIGIEHVSEHWRMAQQNALRLRGKHSPIEALNLSATEYDYDEGTVFYMYNPFKTVIMNSVLEQIHQSLLRRKRWIKIIYANPVHESCLSACSWLTPTERWDAGGSRGLSVPVSFWSANLQTKTRERDDGK